ncbi:MAG: hypothetical protein QY309_13295 [Cyclobacteriaceae bacterium]|nr:MAG: hypothetical protein QY309_13295 [Cyclobacteriaceae bacterium]
MALTFRDASLLRPPKPATAQTQTLAAMHYLRTIFTVGLVFNALSLLACSCGHIGILKTQKKSDFVFKGRLIDFNEIKTKEKFSSSEYEIEYRRVEFVMEVVKIYKGRKLKEFKEQITIVTTGNEADCGYWFDYDQNYIVYAYRTDKKLIMGLEDQTVDKFMTTHLCFRTKKAKFLTFFERLILTLT